MSINIFIEVVKNLADNNLLRGDLIGLLPELKENWIYAIKALLISTVDKHIAKSYILQKLRYCANHVGLEHTFLSIYRLLIYKAIKTVAEKFTAIKRDENVNERKT